MESIGMDEKEMMHAHAHDERMHTHTMKQGNSNEGARVHTAFRQAGLFCKVNINHSYSTGLGLRSDCLVVVGSVVGSSGRVGRLSSVHTVQYSPTRSIFAAALGAPLYFSRSPSSEGLRLELLSRPRQL